MLRSVLCRLVVPSAALLFALPNVSAQDAESLFETGVAAYESGDTDGAIDAFKDALAQNPGHEDAFRFWQQLEQDAILGMLMEGGEVGALAKRFLGIAKVGRAEVLSDPGGARDLVETYMTSGSLASEVALSELNATYGEWAVPALLGPMGDRSDTNRRVLAIKALIRLGDRAVPPLMQVLRSDDVTTRANAAAVLGTIGDVRSSAALAWLGAGDSDAVVRDVASEALNRLGPDLDKMGLRTRDPATLALRLASKWVKGDGDIVKPYAGGQVAWDWQDGGLVGEPILGGLYQLYLAESTLDQAMSLGGGKEIRAGLAAVHASMKAEIVSAGDIAGLEDSDLLAMANESLPALELKLALAGDARGAALGSLLSFDQPAAAAALIGSMGTSRDEVAALRGALDSDYQTVSVAAALALGAQGQADAAVVSVLGKALKSIPDRLVFSIGDTGLSGNAAGWQQLGSPMAVTGLLKAKQFPPKDVIVVRDGIEGVTLDTIVFGLLNDPRSADVPVVIVTDEADLVEARYGDQVAAVLSTVTLADLQAVAGEADMLAQDAAARAIAAANVLSNLPSTATSATAGDVAEGLERAGSDDVKIAILGLAGRAKVALSQVEKMVLAGGSDELRIAALNAAAHLWAAHGGASGAVDALRGVVSAALEDGGEGALGLAAARAQGHLGAGTSNEMAMANG
ncbi:MAG: hypothetical protein ACI9EF_000487 [Pseudohongiellaceae bacterium]|jgi:hypothetical protein